VDTPIARTESKGSVRTISVFFNIVFGPSDCVGFRGRTRNGVRLFRMGE
jgi:hypothetical protein